MRDNAGVVTDDERQLLIERAGAAPPVHDGDAAVLFHYSEDGTIRRFAPHVPPTNPGHPPAVWAIDESHSPLYWFPRHCPRISVWARDPEQQAVLTDVFGTEASRICAAETVWLERVRDAHVHRYVFDASAFRPWDAADGQWIADRPVRPERVDLLDDLLALHARCEIELRFTPRLGALMDQILASGLPFSFVRLRDARR